MTAARNLPQPADQGLFPVAPGETVTAWALSAASGRYYPGEPALAEDRVNYHFVNGFVDVGDLPCRKAWWAEISNRTVELETDWSVESLNLPGFNRRVEFSGFWHRPTLLKRWARTTLVPPRAGAYRFRVATCGGVNIWVDGEHAVKFEPFTRNAEKQAEITLQLKAEGSEIVMLTEELAERDARWFVELQSLSEVTLFARLPGDVSGADLETLKTLATGIRPARDVFSGDPLVLEVDDPAPVAVAVDIRVGQSVHMSDKPPLLETSGVLRAGETRVALEGLGSLPDAYHPLDVTLSIGEARIRRHIGFALLAEGQPRVFAADLADRKHEALAYLAAHGELRVGRVLAALASGRPADAEIAAILEDTMVMIEERRDCSDFVMVPFLWVYAGYRDRLPEGLVARMRETILNYRYWVDEPGNDAMWFWSENHVLCFHTAQLLAGRLLPGEVFAVSGRTGREQEDLAIERLGKWFDAVEREGLAEWNSAAYYPIDFIGLLALQQWGPHAIRVRAGHLLDRLFTMIALHTLGGVPAGSMGRAYDKELRAGPLTELAPFATVAFGEGWLNEGVAALPEFVAGDYSPPGNIAAYASPEPGRAINAHYVQGVDEAARLALYKSQAVQLSSTLGGRPGARGHQQHVTDIRFASHPFARAWINHPGEDDPWGSGRPSYWAGNGVMPRVGQHGDTALMLFDLGDEPRLPFTHAYAARDALDEIILDDTWLVLRAGDGYAALGSSTAISPVTSGAGAGREFRANGARTAWTVIVGEGDGASGFDAFKDMLGKLAFAFDPHGMRLDLSGPNRPTLRLDWSDGLSVDAKPFEFPNRSVEPMVTTLTAQRF